MTSEFQLIQLLIQGGAVSISLALIWLLNKTLRGNKETLDNHLKHQSQALSDVAKSNIKIAKAIQSISDRVSHCPVNRGRSKPILLDES